MTNLDRWKPLAQNVMSELALPDDPQRLVVIATALAGAAQASTTRLEKAIQELRVALMTMLAANSPRYSEQDGALLPRYQDPQKSDIKYAGELAEAAIRNSTNAALSDDGAHAGKQSGSD